MSDLADQAKSLEQIRRSIEEFSLNEQQIRAQFAVDNDVDKNTALLERATRRFLVDEFLKALDWDPGDPRATVEEGRSRSAGDGERLYFDYVGTSLTTNAPVVIVEAKAFDVTAPRKPHGPELTSAEIVDLLVASVDAIKRDHHPAILAEWAEILRDMRTYVQSLDELGRSSLKRLVITAGRWMIVFLDPVETLASANVSRAEQIRCYLGFDEIRGRHVEIFEALYRPRLVDTLPFPLSIPEALRSIRPEAVQRVFRAVLVTTNLTGAYKQPHPARKIYPALVAVNDGGRQIALIDYDVWEDEPRQEEAFEEFLRRLSEKHQRLAERLRPHFGELTPGELDDFPGFRKEVLRGGARFEAVAAVTGEAQDTGDPSFVTKIATPLGSSEWVVVTGTEFFYKSASQQAVQCEFHLWKNARTSGVASGDAPEMIFRLDSFTLDEWRLHCAHGDLRNRRSGRCVVAPIEASLCCKTCIFHDRCWTTDANVLPCKLV